MFTVFQQKSRMSAGHDKDHAIDTRRLGGEPRKLRITAIVNGLRRDIDRVLRAAIGRKIRIDPGAYRIIEDRHLETGKRASIRHPGAAAAG